MRLNYLWKALLLLMGFGGLSACGDKSLPSGSMDGAVSPFRLSSPSGDVAVNFFLTPEEEAAYQVLFEDKVVIDTSLLGFEFKDQPDFGKNLQINSVSVDSVNESWKMPWGEQDSVINHFKGFTVSLQEQEEPARKADVTFRIYDDGVGFRYFFPEQENMEEVVILEENTQFNLTADHQSWWIPGDWDSYEHLYNQTPVSKINALALGDPGLNESNIMENAVHTPFTMKSEDGVYLSIHEADLTDYASMTLLADTSNLSLQSALVNSERLGYAVKRELPFYTPWRTIQLADNPGGLVESKLILNLNEPNKLGDVSWVEPMKYNGIWWEMHLDKSTWDMKSGRHGATTENAKRYIDFAAENNLGGVLVEGWNTGWERWIGFPDREGVFDFVTPYPDYDLEEVADYAKEKGVELIMHHETSAAPRTYEQQMEAAYQLMQKHDINAAKLGYVGKIIPDGEHHHGQWMVNHYRKALETAAKYNVAINIHEPIKPTGLRRTYPNLLTGEGVRGQEFNAWAADGGNPPEHLTILPFTRMLAGPIDYTPGIFNIKLDPYRPNNQVNTTLAQQLAAYVVIYSPVQMAADLPEHYEGHPAFQFIRDVAVDWDESKVLEGEIGDFVTIARREKGTENWFVGSVTDENPREITIDFSFLDEGKAYKAIVYKDGKDAHWDKNPTAYEIEALEVTNDTRLDLQLAPGGGAAISVEPK
ncbi:glycoside hydrolase family 97 protein [Nafulsella turpanensis]|uniref:glycoside hydrolase family 97 protein n=1 Tax=Nafulsella turpanensis TaxID=1265690 RepID=UPI000347C3EC|nr:glycoside hydrolase family 97 protein [Nafulsella turpanensis]